MIPPIGSDGKLVDIGPLPRGYTSMCHAMIVRQQMRSLI